MEREHSSVSVGNAGIKGDRMNNQLVGFGILFFTLIVASDFDATAPLAVAFAYLILLAVLMTAGPIAMQRLAALMGPDTVSGSPSPYRSVRKDLPLT